jgi:hypothetical protein
LITIYARIQEEETCAVFQELGPPQKVKQVLISYRGEDTWFDVTGWNSQSPEPMTSAIAQKIADSGDAQAILIYGGDSGILIKPSDLKEAWDLTSPRQEQRAYMVVASEKDLVLESPHA